MTQFREKAVLMDDDGIRRALMRISHEVVEKNKGMENLVLVGIRTRGVTIAARIAAEIERIEGRELPRGILDITLYRDDLNELSYQPIVHPTEMPIDITGKTIVLVDDVLYTGRTVRAGINALLDIGRPRMIQLAVLIDRGHRELPIRADYVGKNVPTPAQVGVSVRLSDTDGEEKVIIRERA